MDLFSLVWARHNAAHGKLHLAQNDRTPTITNNLIKALLSEVLKLHKHSKAHLKLLVCQSRNTITEWLKIPQKYSFSNARLLIVLFFHDFSTLFVAWSIRHF